MDSSYAVGFTIFMLLNIFQPKGVVNSATITLQNNCSQTVWPVIQDNNSSRLDSTGFVLPEGASRTFYAPTVWSGRFWGRTGCTFNDSGHGSCSTGDCGSGELECNGAGAGATTLAEFALGSASMDFYDVSLVDGYNLPLMIDVIGGTGQCGSTGCVEDLNQRCPPELRIKGGAACRSACDVFRSDEFCCTGNGSPSSCRPTGYSQLFKSACPTAYSYPSDDDSTTFSCTAADYVITFCPPLPSKKPSKSGNVSTTDGSRSGSGSVVNVTEDGRMADPTAGDSTRRHSFGVTIQILTSVIGLAHLATVVPLP